MIAEEEEVRGNMQKPFETERKFKSYTETLSEVS